MDSKSMLPKLERGVSSFIREERGSIPKNSIVSVGSILAASAALAVLAKPAAAASPQPGCSSNHSNNVGHTNSMALAENPSGLTASHSNSNPFHCNHSNHSSHSSGGGGAYK